MEKTWRGRLHEYLGGTVRAMGGLALEVNGIEDHVHLLVKIKSTHRVDYFLRDLKASSSGWIHKQEHSTLFSWQRGYAAFTVSESQIGNVHQYIASQEEHHRKHSYEEEFKALLRAHNIEFDEKYLWE
jgi:putative transposase